MNKTKVLVVDDSAVIRQVLTKIVNNEADMTVVGTAPNPYIARDKLILLKPDVMTLDIEMPRMDGLTFLKKVMRHFPIPTIIVSSVTKEGCKTSMKALEIGAVNVIPKPSEAYSIDSIEKELIKAIRAAAHAKVNKRKIDVAVEEKKSLQPISIATTNKIIAIGASTGGTEALKDVLIKLPANSPGIVMVQHMPPVFTAAFAERLNDLCKIEVREAKDGDVVYPGLALLAPGGLHMVLRREGARYFVRVKDGPQVWHQRPAVDVLFKSVSQFAGPNALGIILTGMGKDGAQGMELMKQTGAINIAQDEKSSVVFGMPKAAIETGSVDYVENLYDIPERVIDIINNKL
ncbi:MAG: chemotaxis response regulator protein-glutamate methylesterase [Candidatus Cloacimonadales bacterium]|jgi:two-component system chemotaxis response regulator CheB|nr:chemotaxis response regulator protein-glutamate methylesterase [Candidatus Cloacimonadota bacterium]MDD2649620.1 chemotaxis response regulator protein-glutamate methylesterase [Candidatus Cloacimonadota bacterium]MDD3501647.1 chemotaxis response regulator protein-glutamate methylesterase [Candidatus Cloacimonadota bacterium]MDX9976602.1 chemotaxis response regulator protein-glutamate methylesterase [Candidatus Cloacimonadales bacterium]